MKPKSLLILLFCLSINLNSIAQSLSPERAKHIKESTVKVTVDGNISIGTGFFINSDGTLLTCWHVIEPAIIRNALTNVITGQKKITITLNNNEKILVGVPIALINGAYNDAIAYDYCILVPITRHASVPFLKIGDFSNIPEGKEVYTCGYPLNLEQQFITKGIVSTKYVDTSNAINHGTAITKMPRNQALLDLTLNKGNSGGAVIAIGATPNDDEVIGIADFIINPIGGNAEALVGVLKKSSGGVFLSGVDPNALFANIIEILNNTSIGISGCVSINHVVAGLALISH